MTEASSALLQRVYEVTTTWLSRRRSRKVVYNRARAALPKKCVVAGPSRTSTRPATLSRTGLLVSVSARSSDRPTLVRCLMVRPFPTTSRLPVYRLYHVSLVTRPLCRRRLLVLIIMRKFYIRKPCPLLRTLGLIGLCLLLRIVLLVALSEIPLSLNRLLLNCKQPFVFLCVK